MKTMRSIAVVASVIALLAPISPASAAYESYVSIKGKKQGKFKGEAKPSTTQRAVHPSTSTPPSTGQKAGRRR